MVTGSKRLNIRYGFRARVSKENVALAFKSGVIILEEVVRFFRIPEVIAAIASLVAFIRALFFTT